MLVVLLLLKPTKYKLDRNILLNEKPWRKPGLLPFSLNTFIPSAKSLTLRHRRRGDEMKFLYRGLLFAALLPAVAGAGIFGKKKSFWDKGLGQAPTSKPLIVTEAGLATVKKSGFVYDSNYSRKELATLALRRTLDVLVHFNEWPQYRDEYTALWRTVEHKADKYPEDQHLQSLSTNMSNVIALAETPGVPNAAGAIATGAPTCQSLLANIGQAVSALKDQLASPASHSAVSPLAASTDATVSAVPAGPVNDVTSANDDEVSVPGSQQQSIASAPAAGQQSTGSGTPLSRSRAASMTASTPANNPIPLPQNGPAAPLGAQPPRAITPAKAAMVFCGIIAAFLVAEFAIYQTAKDPAVRKKSLLGRAFSSVKEKTQKAAERIGYWLAGDRAVIKRNAPEASLTECLQAIDDLSTP